MERPDMTGDCRCDRADGNKTTEFTRVPETRREKIKGFIGLSLFNWAALIGYAIWMSMIGAPPIIWWLAIIAGIFMTIVAYVFVFYGDIQVDARSTDTILMLLAVMFFAGVGAYSIVRVILHQ